MRCDDARRAVSAVLDGEPAPDGLDRHVDTCADCGRFRAVAVDVRSRLRFEVLDEVPDIAGAVRRQVQSGRVGRRPLARLPLPTLPRWRRPAVLVAAAVAGALLGASLVGGLRPGSRPAPVAADLPRRVVAAQTSLDTLTARVEVVERGFHPGVPRRTFSGDLAYRAPEALALRLEDTTTYPSAAWPRNDVALVVDGSREWDSGPAPCPREALPSCVPPGPRVRVVTGRAPFDPDAPAPLDLVLPVASFAGDAGVPEVGERAIDGRPAVGVEVTAAQVDPLLSGLRRAGAWRAIDPGDTVRLWLDRSTLVPLEVDVFPAETAERRRWAAAQGYADEPGAAILTVRFRDVRVNGPVAAGAFPAAPAGARERPGGFEDRPWVAISTPQPTALPAGMRPYRAGVRGGTAVRTWSDGRLWIEVQTSTTWPGGRLFGDLGDVVRRVPAGDGVAYVGEGGRIVGLHGPEVDAAVTGSASAPDLLRVAASLGIAGREVPAGWAEAATATVDTARAAVPGLLLARRVDGFGEPGVRVDDGVVSLAYMGPGAEGFLLVESAGSSLTPPLDADVEGLSVRGLPARYTRSLGALEWIERGKVVALRSHTLGLTQLAAVAGSLRPATGGT